MKRSMELRGTHDHVHAHKQTAASEPSSDDTIHPAPSGNSLLIPLFLHTTKGSFAITTLPSRVAFERQFLGNLQLPKMMHNVLLERTIQP